MHINKDKSRPLAAAHLPSLSTGMAVLIIVCHTTSTHSYCALFLVC